MVKPDIQKMQNISSGKKPKTEFIDLKEAARLFGYTQHHFGLLCRQDKLQAKRIGKKWMTKKEWIEEYLNNVEENYRKTNNHYTKTEIVEVDEEAVKSIGKIKEREKIIPQNLQKKNFLTEKRPKKAETKVPYFAFLRSGSLKNAMSVSFIAVLLWSYAFLGLQVVEKRSDIAGRIAGVFTEISSVSANQNLRVFVQNTKNNFIEFSDSVFAGAVSIKGGAKYAYIKADNKVVQYVNEIKEKMNFTSSDVVAFSLNLRTKSINISKEIYSGLIGINRYEIEDIFRRCKLQFAYIPHIPARFMSGGVFVEIEPMDFVKRTKENIVAFKDDLKVLGGKSKDTFIRLTHTTADYIKDYGKKIKLAFFDTDEVKNLVYRDKDEEEKDVFIDEGIDLPETKEGMVVLPKKLFDGDLEKMEREIKDVFSDEVLVKPDNEGDAGVIYPVFKEGKGEEYLYVMVPIDKKETTESSVEKEI